MIISISHCKNLKRPEGKIRGLNLAIFFKDCFEVLCVEFQDLIK